MRRLLIVVGWLCIAGGCVQGVLDRLDEPAADLSSLDATAGHDRPSESSVEGDVSARGVAQPLQRRQQATERPALQPDHDGPSSRAVGPSGTTSGTTGIHSAASDVTISEAPSEAGVDQASDSVEAHAASGDEHAYAGPIACAPCHLQQYQSWKETKMARAFELLKPGNRVEAKLKANLDPQKDYTADKSCLPCHVTGYGKPGGFVDIESTPQLAGVTCEVCHGPGGTYLAKGLKKNPEYVKADLVANGLVDTVTRDLCVQCHNKQNPLAGEDYQFDFIATKEKGTHQHFPLLFSH